MQRIGFLRPNFSKIKLDDGFTDVCKKFEGGRSWLIVLHHHCRNPRRLMKLFKLRIRTIQEQK